MNIKKLLSHHLDTRKSVMIYTRANSVVVRTHPRHVNQPGTPAQQRVWNRMRAVQSFLKPLKGLISESFREVTQKGYPYAQATKYMMREALVEDGENLSIDYSRCWLSMGSLDPLPDFTVRKQGERGIRVTWTVEEGERERKDQNVSLIFVAESEYLGDESMVWMDMDRLKVTEGVMDVQEYPRIVVSTRMHIYCMAHTKDRKKWAKSQYIGRLSNILEMDNG